MSIENPRKAKRTLDWTCKTCGQKVETAERISLKKLPKKLKIQVKYKLGTEHYNV